MATTSSRAVIDLVINGQQSQTTMRQISNGVGALKREMLDMAQADNPALYAKRGAELQKMLQTQRQMRSEVFETASGWSKIGGSIGTITAGLLGGTILTAIPGQISAASKKIVEYRDSLSDVAKTTNMTIDEVKALNEELKLLDTRTPTKELREMAAVGGQFGIAKKDIEDFTVAADKLNIALGDQFGGAEATAETIVKLRNTFLDLQTQDVGADMMHIGNAINVLEAAGAATAPVMADFASRIGGVAIPMGMTTAEVLGLSAALQEMNVTSERGSSAVTDILMGMAKAPDAFAQYAVGIDGLKLGTEKFKNLLKTDLSAALLSVAKGLGAGNPDAMEFAKRLDDMDLKGNGVTEVLMKMSSGTQLITDKMLLAAPAVKAVASVTEEVNKKNDQLAKDLKTLDESFEALYTSQAVQDFVGSVVRGAAGLMKLLPQLVGWLSQNTTAVWSFVTAMVMLNARLIDATLRSAYLTAAVATERLTLLATATATGLISTATAAYSTIMAATTTRTKIATAAQLLWNLALSLNPIGLVVAGITALVAGLKFFSEHTERARKVQDALNAAHDKAAKVLKEEETAQKSQNAQLDKWNQLSGVARTALERDMITRRGSLKLRMLEIQAKIKENQAIAESTTLWQDAKAFATAGSMDEFRKNQAEYRKENKLAVQEALQGDLDALNKQVAGYDASLTRLGELKSGKAAAVTGGGSGGSGGSGSGKDKKGKAAKGDPFREAMDREFGAEYKQDDTLSEYEKESMAFAERFSKLYQLAGNNLDKIKEVDRQNMAAWAIVEANEKKRQAEATKKQAEKDNKTGYDKDLHALDMITEERDHQTAMLQTGGVSEAVKNQTKLQLQETYLQQKLDLQKKHNQEFADTEAQLTSNQNQQVELRKQNEEEMSQAVIAARKAQIEADKQLYAEGIAGLADFVSENTVAYKALIVASKAFAIAEIMINTERQISQIWADPKFMLLGFGGIGAQVAATALAAGRSAASIAKLSGLAGREEGGYTGVGDLYVDKSGSPGGYVNRPTLFALGQRSYIAGEGHKEEYVIPYPMLKQPAVANMVAMLEAQRTGRAFAKGGSTAMTGAVGSASMSMIPSGGSASGGQDLLAVLVKEMQLSRALQEEIASRPIVNDYLAQEREAQYVQHIRNVVGVSSK